MGIAGKQTVLAVSLSVLMLGWGGGVAAQQSRAATLADIRQDLSVLYVEVQRLKRELSTTNSPSVPATGGSVYDRLQGIEAELKRLTGQTERLAFRVERVVKDGTNRIGDLEFRLVELEGGDVSKLGQTTTLGGDAPQDQAPVAVVVAPATPGGGDNSAELAVGEAADLQRAQRAMEQRDYTTAITVLEAFSENYPGSPQEVDAHVLRGDAHAAQGDTRNAARAYLAAFSASPTGPLAPQALTRLGAQLGALGQQDQACITLSEVKARFPASQWVGTAGKEMARLGCS